MPRKLLSLFLSLFIVGCAGLDGSSPKDLLRPTKLTSFVLKDDVIGEMTSTNVVGSKTNYSIGLLKGKYISVFADANGTYYQGEKGCIYHSLTVNKSVDGGIWMPKQDSTEEPRFWFYLKPIELGQFGAGPLGVALANVNAGNVKKEWSTKIEPFLLDKIRIQDE